MTCLNLESLLFTSLFFTLFFMNFHFSNVIYLSLIKAFQFSPPLIFPTFFSYWLINAAFQHPSRKYKTKWDGKEKTITAWFLTSHVGGTLISCIKLQNRRQSCCSNWEIPRTELSPCLFIDQIRMQLVICTEAILNILDDIDREKGKIEKKDRVRSIMYASNPISS